ncbi:uncharacterized protein LOC112094004 [Morus notabilis]|uniref:uncharacterized protein LOC112094004 n=1 Tax=Morus notabilis TaxID=981085 RepID=UPI000CED209E|nr:uncharacterized protein LOC112094004 [Morus notabilis]
MAPFEALYGRPCRSPVCWLESEDRLTLGSDVIQENNEKIAVVRERLLTAQSRQKSYADRRRRPLEFSEGGFVLLRVSPRKGVTRFGKCQPNPEAIVQWYDVPIQYDTTYKETPIQILDRKMKSLRQCEIPLVKVLWQHHGVEEATWELETTMQERYPYMFIS